MKKISFLFGVVLVVLFLSIGFIGQVSAADWQYASIARGTGVAPAVAITLGSDNKAHLVYTESVNGSYYLKYATNASGSFVSETVDVGSGLGQYPSIAIGYDNKVHVSYYDSVDKNLKYATNSSGMWAASAIDIGGEVGSYSSIGVDTDGYVHISYYDISNGDLKYARKSGRFGFVLSTIDSSSSSVGLLTSLAIDSSNKIHISYYDLTNQSLKYITNSSGSFSAQTIDSANVGMYSSIKIDNGGYAHISYYDAGNKHLKYTNNMLGYWSNSTIDNSANVGLYSSLVVDSNSRVRIGYYDADNLKFKLANNVGTVFSTTIVDEIGYMTGLARQPISLAMDSSNKLYTGLFYLYSLFPWDGEVKFAYIPGPSFSNVKIELGKKYVNTRNVNLKLLTTGNPIEMMISEDSGFTGAKWEVFNANKTVKLSSGSGKKTVYVKLRDSWYAESATAFDTIKYLPEPIFVAKKAKNKEVLIKKKNRKYTAPGFSLTFVKLPKLLKKTKYYWQITRYKKYPKTYKLTNKNLIKKYWKIEGNFNKYKPKDVANNFKVKFKFSYSKIDFKKWQTKNKGLSEKGLVLKKYNAKKKKWVDVVAKHNLKKNNFEVVIDSPIDFKVARYMIGTK